MRLTGTGKVFFFVVGLAMLGYGGWAFYSSRATTARPSEPVSTPTGAAASTSTAPAVPTATKGVLARVKSSGILRVGMEPDAPPLHFINDRQQEEGFDFRIAAEVAKKLGVPRVQVVEADYEDLPGLARDGKVDLVMGGYVPDASIASLEWSQGYLDFGLCLIVAEGTEGQFKQPADL